MSKFENLLWVVNALHNKGSISLESIMSICEVTARTAYRYVQTISVAGMPIYLDRDIHAYRLLTKSKIQIGNLRPDEIIVIAVALEILADKLSSHNRDAVQSILQKVLSSQPSPIEDILSFANEKVSIELRLSDGDLNEYITSRIVIAGILLNRRLQLTLKNGQKEKTVRIDRPKLNFRNEVVLSDFA